MLQSAPLVPLALLNPASHPPRNFPRPLPSFQKVAPLIRHGRWQKACKQILYGFATLEECRNRRLYIQTNGDLLVAEQQILLQIRFYTVTDLGNLFLTKLFPLPQVLSIALLCFRCLSC